MQHEQLSSSDGDEMELEALEGAASSSGFGQSMRFNVDGIDVVGVHDDLVGLVGCEVMLTFEGWSRSYRCFVDAFAPDAPGGSAYVISWKGNGRWDAGRCLYLQSTMADVAHRGIIQQSAGVKAKLEGTCTAALDARGMVAAGSRGLGCRVGIPVERPE